MFFDDEPIACFSHLLDLALHIQHPSNERYTWFIMDVMIGCYDDDDDDDKNHDDRLKVSLVDHFHTFGL